jgi:hypothetical protein
LNLGKKIYDCILEQGSCSFEAELWWFEQKKMRRKNFKKKV